MRTIQTWAHGPFETRHWLILLATLTAACLRFLLIDTLPPAAWYDEIWYMLRGRGILTTGQVPAFYETYFGGANAGPVYMVTVAQALGFTQITGGRWSIAFIAIPAIPFAYACFRELLRVYGFGRDQRRIIALLGAIFLAWTSAAVIISRVGMENWAVVPTGLFVIWQLLRGIHRGKMSGWIMAGLAAGLAQYNGLHARFLIPVMVLLFAQDFLFADRQKQIAMLKGGLLLALIGTAISIPLIRFFLTHPELFTARAEIVSQVPPWYTSRGDMIRVNAAGILVAFTFTGSLDPLFTVPGLPLLDGLQSIGFLVGVGWCLLNLHRSSLARLLPVWLFIGVAPSLFTEGAPNLGRMTGMWPALILLAALGWGLIFGWIGSRLTASWSQALTPAVAIIVLGSGVYNAYQVFWRWPAAPGIRDAFNTVPVELARTMVARAESEPVFIELIPGMVEDVVGFDWILPGSEVRRMDFRKCQPRPYRRDARTTYVVLTEADWETVPLFRELYPSAIIDEEIDLWQTPAALIEIPPGAAAPGDDRPELARFDPGIALIGVEQSAAEAAPGETLSFTLHWRVDAPIDEDLTHFLHVGEGSEAIPLVAQADDKPCLGLYLTHHWLPGEIIPDAFSITIPAEAPPGEYPVIIGWYEWPSFIRQPLLEADHELSENRAVIGTLVVR